MACILTQNITKEDLCDWAVGGVKRVGVISFPVGKSVELTFAESGCTDVDVTAVALPEGYEADWIGIEAAENGVSFSVELTTTSNGGKILTPSLSINLDQISCALLSQLKALLIRPIMAEVEMNDGNIYLIGTQNGLKSNTFALNSGASAEDGTSVNIVWSGADKYGLLRLSDWIETKA